MVEINYEKFLSDLVKPLVAHPDEVMVKIFSEEDDVIILQIMVNEEDKGRVIGRNGRIINAIKTIAYASASKSGKNVENMDDDELIEEWEKTQEQEEAKDFISSVKHLFKDDEPQKPENKVCAYCGTEFGASSNKCPSCGAKLTKK